MSALRELLAKFSIEVDSKELEEGEKKVEGFLGKLKEAGSVIAEAFAVDKIKEFVEGQVEAGTQLERTSIRLGTTTGELQAMQLAAAEAGVSAESLATGLRFLNRHIGEASKGTGDGAKIFKDLGISLKNADGSTRNATDILGEFADSIVKIPDAAKRTEVAMKLLGRGGVELVPLLLKGGDAFREAREQMEQLGGGISEGFIEKAKEAEEQQAKLNFALSGLKSTIAEAVLPVLSKVVAFFTTAAVKAIDFAKHTNVLSTAMTFFGTIAAAKALQSLIGLAKEFGLLKGSILGSVGAMLRFALPLILVGLLYLAFDELWTLLKGGDSLIGDALGPEKAGFVRDLQSAVDSITSAFGSMGEALGGDGTAMDAFRVIVVDTAKALAWLLELMAKVMGGISYVSNKVASVFYGEGEKDEPGQEGTKYLTPEAREKYKQLQAKPLDENNPIAGDQHLANERRIVEAIAARKAALARGEKPAPDAFVPVGNEFTGPPSLVPKSFVGPTAKNEQRSDKGVVIHQQNKIDVHGVDTNNAKAVGDAVGPGIATATQRDMDRARTAKRLP